MDRNYKITNTSLAYPVNDEYQEDDDVLGKELDYSEKISSYISRMFLMSEFLTALDNKSLKFIGSFSPLALQHLMPVQTILRIMLSNMYSRINMDMV